MSSSSSSSSLADFCPRCKTHTVMYDEEHLHVACTKCHFVKEDQVLQAQVEFQEADGGPARPVGSYISTKQARALPGQHHRDALTEEARTKMSRWAQQMEPPIHKTVTQSALRYYQLAVEKKFTRGRRLDYVLGVCMYAACRDEIPRLINDFVAVADLNSYVFVVTLLHFSARVHKLQKLVDPIVYIQRFAGLLDFGDKAGEIASTAERIVARMKRDWIHQGRRPSGVSGAALIIAARIHGFDRTKTEIASVVRVGGPTIALRLDEFNGTDSATLSVNEFFSFDLPDEADPPSYIRSVREIENSTGFKELVDQADVLALELDHPTSGNTNPSTTADLAILMPHAAVPPPPPPPPPPAHIPKSYTKRLPQHSEELDQLRIECEEELAEAGVEVDTSHSHHHGNLWKGMVTLPPDAVPFNVNDGNAWSGRRVRVLDNLDEVGDPGERRAREGITSVVDLTPYETDLEVVGSVLTDSDWQRKKAVWDRVHAKFLEKNSKLMTDEVILGSGNNNNPPSGIVNKRRRVARDE